MVLREELEDDPPPPPPPAAKPNPATPAIHPVVEDAVFVRSCSSSFLTRYLSASLMRSAMAINVISNEKVQACGMGMLI